MNGDNDEQSSREEGYCVPHVLHIGRRASS